MHAESGAAVDGLLGGVVGFQEERVSDGARREGVGDDNGAEDDDAMRGLGRCSGGEDAYSKG